MEMVPAMVVFMHSLKAGRAFCSLHHLAPLKTISRRNPFQSLIYWEESKCTFPIKIMTLFPFRCDWWLNWPNLNLIIINPLWTTNTSYPSFLKFLLIFFPILNLYLFSLVSSFLQFLCETKQSNKKYMKITSQ